MNSVHCRLIQNISWWKTGCVDTSRSRLMFVSSGLQSEIKCSFIYSLVWIACATCKMRRQSCLLGAVRGTDDIWVKIQQLRRQYKQMFFFSWTGFVPLDKCHQYINMASISQIHFKAVEIIIFHIFISFWNPTFPERRWWKRHWNTQNYPQNSAQVLTQAVQCRETRIYKYFEIPF